MSLWIITVDGSYAESDMASKRVQNNVKVWAIENGEFRKATRPYLTRDIYHIWVNLDDDGDIHNLDELWKEGCDISFFKY